MAIALPTDEVPVAANKKERKPGSRNPTASSADTNTEDKRKPEDKREARKNEVGGGCGGCCGCGGRGGARLYRLASNGVRKRP